MSITTSSWGREQQINRFPAAGGSSGSGSYFTDPEINPHSQVWHTPVRQDQRTGTSQASASSSGCSRPCIKGFRRKRGLRAVREAELGLVALPKRGSFPGIGCNEHSNQERTPHDPVYR